VALYVHVPFCVSLCPYCDFVVLTGRASRGPANRIDAFLDALHVELDLRADIAEAIRGTRAPLRSLYLGGGTPSLLTPAAVAALIEHVRSRFGLATDAEITLEANPGPDEHGDLSAFRRAGITRLSLGAQSLQPAELTRLGRRHRPADVESTISAARNAEFSSVSLDLLTDIPGQTLETWRDTLGQAIAMRPDHVSVYALGLDDPDTEGLTGPNGDHLPVRPGARRWRERARPEQDEDRAADMDAITDELLGAAGIERYELANHARSGHESRHNLAYWHALPHEALGPGGHAFDGALERRWNAARLAGYVEALTPQDGSPARLPPGGRDRVEPAVARAESVILGLRLREGVARAGLLEDPEAGPALAWAVGEGLAEIIDERLRLTSRGRGLSNEVFVRLLPSRQSGRPS
jgi:putative oxygen-independent coproporphyrinogen III oxidase